LIDKINYNVERLCLFNIKFTILVYKDKIYYLYIYFSAFAIEITIA